MVYDLCFRKPRLTVLVLGLILVAGLTALNSLPRQEDPALTERYGSVTVTLPGASAERVEALITEKLENALQEVEEVKHLNSRSQTGFSIVSIELEDHVFDVDPVWSRIRDKVADAEAIFPADARVLEVKRNTTAAFTLLVGLTWVQDDTLQIDLLHRLAKDLRQELVALQYTKEVELYGEPEEEVLVTLDSATLASRNLTATEIAQRISQADAKIPAGRLQSDRNDLIIEVAGELDSVDRVRSVPILKDDTGQMIRVGDIAQVSKTPRDPPETMAIIHGHRGIVIAAKMETNRRVDRWAASARTIVDDFTRLLPPGVKAEIIFDQSIHTDERLGGLVDNLLIGAAIVVVVLFFMMGLRAAIIVASALPLTVLLILPSLNALDVPLHQISLTGLIIALGLLIDNAIVAYDDYVKARLAGHDRAEAITVTVRHLLVPLAASTVTTALTFMPLVIMPGNAGEFVSALGTAVILSIVYSLVISLTLIPALAAFTDRRDRILPGQGFMARGISSETLLKGYRWTLDKTLARPWIGIAISLVIPVSGFVLASQLIEQFFPPVDRNQFQVQLKLPDQTAITETERQVHRARDIMLRHPEVENSVWFIGETPPRVFYNVTILEDANPSFAGGFVNTRSSEGTHALVPVLQKELMQAFPEASLLALPYEQGPPIEAPLEVRIYGPDIHELQRLGEEVRLILSQTLNVTYTRATITGGRPKLDLIADEDQASLAGFNLVDLARELNASLDGVVGGSVLEGTEELPVRVRVGQADRADLERIVANTVRPPVRDADTAREAVSGVPLNALGRIALAPQINLITRRDGERYNKIQAYVDPFTLPGKALIDFEKRMAERNLRMPAGYRLQLGGEKEGSGEARANLMGVFAPLIVLMISTVVLAFNSFRYAGLIGMVAVFSIGGALFTLWLFGFPMGFMAVIGTMGLIGLAINDSIVVLSALIANEKARAADQDAIREVVVVGSRHIISTTLTTIGGFLPLIIWGGIFWPPLAIAVAGGMIGATLLALFFVPPVFTIFVRRDKRRNDKKRLQNIVLGKEKATAA